MKGFWSEVLEALRLCRLAAHFPFALVWSCPVVVSGGGGFNKSPRVPSFGGTKRYRIIYS
jgi:hypothetical protein